MMTSTACDVEKTRTLKTSGTMKKIKKSFELQKKVFRKWISLKIKSRPSPSTLK
jgi:hypothetical protein